MSEFTYQATDGQGRLVRGRMAAVNLRAAQRSLRAQGLQPVTVEATDAPVQRQRSPFARGIQRQELVLLLSELSTMLGAGVPLVEAVQSATRAERHPDLVRRLHEIERSLRGGSAFGAALQRHLPSLPNFVFQLVAAGEAVGELGGALADAAKQMQYDLKLRQDLIQALLYPAILVTAGGAAVLFIFTAVVPRFAAILENRQAPLPWISRAVIRTGLFVEANLLPLLLLLAVLAFAFALLLRRPAARRVLLDFSRRVPVLGAWLVEAEAARWATLLATLLGNRIQLLPALQLARAGLTMPRLQGEMIEVERAVRGGQPLAAALAAHTELAPGAVNMVRVGERAGNLSQMLRAYAELATRNAETRMKRVLVLIEPAAILIIGGLIGLIVASIMLAVSSISAVAV